MNNIYPRASVVREEGDKVWSVLLHEREGGLPVFIADYARRLSAMVAAQEVVEKERRYAVRKAMSRARWTRRNVPQVLIDILNEASGLEHDRSGRAVSTLAAILNKHDEMQGASCSMKTRCSLLRK